MLEPIKADLQAPFLSQDFLQKPDTPVQASEHHIALDALSQWSYFFLVLVLCMGFNMISLLCS